MYLSPAWNQGIRETDAPFVLLLNPDTEWWAGTLADYALPTAEAFPSIDAITLEEAPSKLNPLGAKGAGEGGIVAVGAAAANAVAAAVAPLGVVIRDLPLSPPALAALVHGARGAG